MFVLRLVSAGAELGSIPWTRLRFFCFFVPVVSVKNNGVPPCWQQPRCGGFASLLRSLKHVFCDQGHLRWPSLHARHEKAYSWWSALHCCIKRPVTYVKMACASVLPTDQTLAAPCWRCTGSPFRHAVRQRCPGELRAPSRPSSRPTMAVDPSRQAQQRAASLCLARRSSSALCPGCSSRCR